MYAVHPEALPPPPPPAPPKGKKAEPLPPAVPLDPTAFHWTGDKHVYLVQLDISPESIKSRYRCGSYLKHGSNSTVYWDEPVSKSQLKVLPARLQGETSPGQDADCLVLSLHSLANAT